jgi:Cu(I)/Ag(I) efflux system membrane protein CusA/SilA
MLPKRRTPPPFPAPLEGSSSGIRTPVGVKVLGTDLGEMEKLARQIEAVIRTVPGTTSAYAERVIGGYYLNIDPDRAQLARYGLMVGDLQNLIAMALGAEPVTTTVEGRERYTVSIRYPRDYRSDPQAIATEVLIPMGNAEGRPFTRDDLRAAIMVVVMLIYLDSALTDF